MNKLLSKLKTHSSEIVTFFGCVGSIGAMILGINAGYKNGQEGEHDYKNYILPTTLEAVSVASIIYGNVLSKKQQAALLASGMAISSAYNRYRQEVIRRHGEEEDKDIIKHMTVCADPEYHCIDTNNPDSVKAKWVIDFDIPGLRKYEIYRYERDVLHAEYHLNRNYAIGYNVASLEMFLDFLGVHMTSEERDIASQYHWYMDGLYFIDFYHKALGYENDIPVYEIRSVWEPIFGEEE